LRRRRIRGRLKKKRKGGKSDKAGGKEDPRRKSVPITFDLKEPPMGRKSFKRRRSP